MPSPQSFQSRLLLALASVLVAVGIVWTVASWRDLGVRVEREERARLEAVVRTAALQLDGDLLAAVADEGAPGEEREALLHALAAAAEANSLERELLALRIAPERSAEVSDAPRREHTAAIEVVVSSSASAAPERRLDYLPTLRHALLEGVPGSMLRIGKDDDRGISAYAPVRDSRGELVCVLSTHVPLEPLLLRRRDEWAARSAPVVGVLCLALLLTYLLTRSLTRGLTRLSDQAEHFGDGDFDTPFESESSMRELRQLSESLEHARQRIRQDLAVREDMVHSTNRARRETERAMEVRSQFLANMSHEIRTPMNGVIGVIELLLASPLNEEQRDLARTAATSGTALLRIIDDVLDFSKLDAGRVVLESIPFDLRSTVEDAVESLTTALAGKAVQLNLFMADSLPTMVIGDPTRLRQVLTNLVGNAAKFTAEGEICCEVQEVERSPGALVLEFRVRDTGIGINPGQAKILFEAFSQADGSSTRRFGGTGLGLSICRQLVDLMGGTISARPAPGGGSIFQFTARFELKSDELYETTVQDGLLIGMRILVCDDNDTVIHSLEHHLGGRGAELHVSRRAEYAYDLLERRPFDLILTELVLPGAGGGDLARRAAASESNSRTPVVAMSGFSEPLRRARESSELFDAVLSKPLRRRQLTRVLKRAVEGAGKEPEAPLPKVPESSAARVSDEREELVLSVLLVEDNLVNRKVGCSMLERLNCRVTCAEDGNEALSCCESAQFDLILMDCQMPGMDGYEATRRLKARGGRFAETPVVALTANAMEGDRERALSAGMDDYLTKPVRLEDLARALQSWCPG